MEKRTQEAKHNFDRALGAIRKNRLEDARHLLTQAVLFDADHVDAQAALGALLLDSGEIDKANEAIDRALSLAPDNCRIHLLSAVAHHRAGRPHEAMREANVAASIEPLWPEVHRQLGQLYGSGGDFSAAVDAWRKVVELTAGKERESITALGIALSQAGRHDESIAVLERACTFDPYDPTGYADLGMAQFRAGRMPEARQLFARALEASAGSAQAHLGMGLVHAHHRAWADAVRELRLAARLAPNSAIAHYNLGLALEALNEKELARVSLLQAAALAPDDVGMAAAVRRMLTPEERALDERDSSNSISGDLQRFPVTNLLEFLRMQTKSGTLTVNCKHGIGMVQLHEGRLVSASSPRAKRLGEMLVDRDLITREQFERALLEQTTINSDPEGLSFFGAIVVRHGWLSKDALRDVMLEQIITALNDIITWDQGTFSFHVVEGALEPRPALTFDLQHTILELFRRRDEYDGSEHKTRDPR